MATVRCAWGEAEAMESVVSANCRAEGGGGKDWHKFSKASPLYQRVVDPLLLTKR